MRLVIIGGGGFRVPLVIRAVVTATNHIIDDVVLYDVDQTRLATIHSVIAAESSSGKVGVRTSTSLPEALDGADFVFCAIRVGGAAGRVRDERRALRLGLLGQETVGAGGLAYGLRTVGVALDLARLIARCAPTAWVINFTNPAGMITEAMRTVLGDRVIGICDSPIGLVNRACRALGLDPAGLDSIDYVGINHLGWLRSLFVDGTDRLPELLASDVRLMQMEEGRLFGPDLLRTIGAIGNEYLYYYYRTDEVVDALVAAPSTRGEILLAEQAEFYERSRSTPANAAVLWEQTRLRREQGYLAEARAHDEPRNPADLQGGGYEHVALAVMAALAGGAAQTLIVNVANQGTLAQLPDDLVIETAAVIDADGARAVPTRPLSLEQAGLIALVRASERAIIHAVMTGARSEAIRAFAIHPLVGSFAQAQTLVSSVIADEPTVADILS